MDGQTLKLVDGSNIFISTATFVLGKTGTPKFPPSVLDGTPPPGSGLANGTFTITGAAEWNSGGQFINTVVTMLGSLDIGTALIAPAVMVNSQLWLFGSTKWDNKQDVNMSNSTINNAGAFTVANSQSIVDLSPAGQNSSFDNVGSFVKQAGTAATTIGVAFTNQGTLNFNGTTISFGETLQQTASGAVTDLGGGTMTLTGGNSTFLLSAGELTGAAGATINGSLTNSGLVDFGSAFGGLAIAGDYTQTAGGTLTVNTNGILFDWLNVSGQANLGGHLQLVGSQGGEAEEILQPAEGVFGAFADATAPWTVLYFGGVWVQ